MRPRLLLGWVTAATAFCVAFSGAPSAFGATTASVSNNVLVIVGDHRQDNFQVVYRPAWWAPDKPEAEYAIYPHGIRDQSGSYWNKTPLTPGPGCEQGTHYQQPWDEGPPEYEEWIVCSAAVSRIEIAAGGRRDDVQVGGLEPRWDPNPVLNPKPVRIRGGAGSDTLYTFGQGSPTATLIGGPGHDYMGGGEHGLTVMRGGLGDDQISADEGSPDKVFGGPGDDFIDAKDGVRDIIRGGRGADHILHRDRGRDVLFSIECIGYSGSACNG